MSNKPRIVVLGGGFGGLEAIFYLKHVLGDRGELTLGYYLPWRFGAGKPFHAGFAWNVMDLGLNAMARVMAD